MPCTQAKTVFPRCKASSSNTNFRSHAQVCPFLPLLLPPLGVHFCHGVAARQPRLCWFDSLWVHVMSQIKQLIQDKKRKRKKTRVGQETYFAVDQFHLKTLTGEQKCPQKQESSWMQHRGRSEYFWEQETLLSMLMVLYHRTEVQTILKSFHFHVFTLL